MSFSYKNFIEMVGPEGREPSARGLWVPRVVPRADVAQSAHEHQVCLWREGEGYPAR